MKEPPFNDVVEIGNATWKVPFWQEPPRRLQLELAVHEDGPLRVAQREGYLQKRAGSSRWRWNVRYFEVKDGLLSWWRPAFKDQLFQPNRPRVALAVPRPKPRRILDLRQLKSVTRTKVKFPYSTRILLKFHEAYSDYQLELRSEREIEIMEWYSLLLRFTMESYEVEVEEDPPATDRRGGSDSD